MPPSDHYCIETSGDHHGIDRVVPSSDHCCTETVALSRLEFTANRVCISQSSDSERARDQWQCAAVTPAGQSEYFVRVLRLKTFN